MPWTKKQQHVAQAVAHGWQPKGAAKGFAKTVKSGAHKGMSLADDIVSESKTMPTKPAVGESDEQRKRRKLAESKLGKGARMAPKY